jgi:hypothetical protein
MQPFSKLRVSHSIFFSCRNIFPRFRHLEVRHVLFNNYHYLSVGTSTMTVVYATKLNPMATQGEDKDQFTYCLQIKTADICTKRIQCSFAQAAFT